jgi:uncharacterized membrane protein
MTEKAGAELTPQERRHADPDRLMTFTDGVFAIIITILVLDIKVPELGSGQSLTDTMSDIQPTMIAFVVSFLLVGMYWVWHRGTFTEVRFVDHNAIWLNLMFLLPVSLIPFAASALGEYSTNATALHIYGVVLIVATLMRTLLLYYLHRHPGLLWESPTKKGVRLSTTMAVSPVLVYVIAILVADSFPTLSFILYFAVPVLYFVAVTFLKADPRTKVSAEGVS